MTPARLAVMPDWPVRMTSDVAALFMCLSETAFLDRYKVRGSFTEGANRFWSRAWLEREVARQAGLPHAHANGAGGDESWADFR